MHRVRTIDICRGLLFVMMVNTHALTLAGAPAAHWLHSGLWLPNGWATMVFVVLSGYGVGQIFAPRLPADVRDRALRLRGWQILGVMLASNTCFAVLRQAMAGQAGAMAAPGWWLGFFTLETPWTISGVLLPTALVVLGAPLMLRAIARRPWLVLAGLAGARLLASLLLMRLEHTPQADGWVVRFLLLEGFGGFAVLPFVLNGCLGMWLGAMRHRSERLWRTALAGLLAAQAAVYLNSWLPYSEAGRMLTLSLGPLGKFAWMYAAAALLSRPWLAAAAQPVQQIGRYALGSFVMHRVFLQGLAAAGLAAGIGGAGPELRYVLLFSGTLLLTWSLCAVRPRLAWIDAPLRRVAM